MKQMKSQSGPLVSIVTPVYNGERYLEECIQSVLTQTYTNVEYLIVNNCSTDATLSIARRYELLDKRIKVYDYREFVDVIESHNRAFRLVSPESKYCKVVSSDDCLFPDCIAQMVELAEANPTVGIVGSYALSGGSEGCRVTFDGLPYGTTVISGREACRWHLLGGRYFLGMPTSVIYRSDLVRGAARFYPNSREHADISAFYECLRTTDFGFVHQVLAYERVHEDALGAKAKPLASSAGSHLLDLRDYGPRYLSKEELGKRTDDALRSYCKIVAAGIINFKGREFWKYHKAILEESGCPRVWLYLGRAFCMKVADLLFNPKQTLEKVLRRRKISGQSTIDVQRPGDWLSEMNGSSRAGM